MSLPVINPTENAAYRVLIGLNPRAGASRRTQRLEQLRVELMAAGMTVETFTDRECLAAAANELHQRGELRALVAAGGDGTVSDLVNRTEPGVPIAIFPLGTENLLAKHLKITSDPRALAQLIAAGRNVRLDAGRANGRLFLLMASCGFDADVVQRLHEIRQGHITHWSWAKPIWESIWNYPYPEFTIRYVEQNSHEPERMEPLSVAKTSAGAVTAMKPLAIERSAVARWAFVSNLPCYAGQLRFTPKASANDGLVDLCTFGEGSLWAGFRYLTGVIFGQHERMPDCLLARASRVRIESSDPMSKIPVPYQLDGDPGGYLPLEIDVLPQRLTLLVPAA